MKKTLVLFILGLSVLFSQFAAARTINVVFSKVDPEITGFKFKPLQYAEYISPHQDFTDLLTMTTSSPNRINAHINTSFAFAREDGLGECEFNVWSGGTYFNQLGVTPNCRGQMIAFVSQYTKVAPDVWEINVHLKGLN